PGGDRRCTRDSPLSIGRGADPFRAHVAVGERSARRAGRRRVRLPLARGPCRRENSDRPVVPGGVSPRPDAGRPRGGRVCPGRTGPSRTRTVGSGGRRGTPGVLQTGRVPERPSGNDPEGSGPVVSAL